MKNSRVSFSFIGLIALLVSSSILPIISSRKFSLAQSLYNPAIKSKFEPWLWEKVQKLEANGTTRFMSIGLGINCTPYKPNRTATYEFKTQVAALLAEEHNATILYIGKVLSFIDIKIEVSGIKEIAAYDFITRIGDGEAKVTLDLDVGPEVIRSSAVVKKLGYNSSGIRVAILDTGIDASHPDFEGKNITWYVHGNRFLLNPQESKRLRGEFDIPLDLPLGEYNLRFGVEGQFLSPSSTGQIATNQTSWAMPITLEVKLPLTGVTLFISHSTENMSLMRSLSNYLDIQGITPIIAEDISSPGARLPEKFQEQIRECDIFLALLTHEATRSKWVLYETNYALSINKPRILLKEKSVNIESIDQYEWIPFSVNEPVGNITSKVLNAVETIKRQVRKPIALPLGGIILVGILAFVAGLAIGARRR